MGNQAKRFKEIFHYLLIFAMVFTVGYFLLVIVYALPTERIKANITESQSLFKKEGSYPNVIPGRDETRLDNFTDALMLLTAENENSDSIWKEALLNKRLSTGIDPVNTLLSVHKNQEVNCDTVSYGRYWHGYLIYLKPLLMILNYQQIRCLLFLLHSGLLFGTAYLIGKRNRGIFAVPLFITIYFLTPQAYMFSLQYTPVMILTMLQLIFFLIFEAKYKNGNLLYYHFFLVGCLTVYFDLLTYPLATFGIPIIFWISQYEPSWKKGLLKSVKSGILWAIGYGTMWAAKWILGTLITEENIIFQAFNSIIFRTNDNYDGEVFHLSDVILRNLNVNHLGLKIAAAVLIICLLTDIVRKSIKLTANILPVIFIAFLPFIWYAVLKNHSWLHRFMACRELAITVYAILTIVFMICVPSGKEAKNQD